MAYKRSSRKRKSSKRTELEKLAYNMGKIEKGLKNPNSKVYASYKKGCSKNAVKNKKPLI